MENNIKNNIKTLRKQILELQAIFKEIVGDLWNEKIKKFYEKRCDMTETVRKIEKIIGGEDE